MQISIGTILEWSPFEPANFGARPVKCRKHLPTPAWSYPVCTHASAGRAHSTAMRAMLGCMDRDDDAHGKRTVECDWRKRRWGLGEPTHI